MSIEIMVYDPTPKDLSRPFSLFPLNFKVDSLGLAMAYAIAAKNEVIQNNGVVFIQDPSCPAYSITDNRHPTRVEQQTTYQPTNNRS